MSSTNKNLDYDSLFKEIDRYNELPVSNESFSEYLTRIKYHNQISNKKLADRTGLSEATVCRYLTGSAKRMTGIVKKCAVIEYPKSEIGIYQAA